MSNADSIPFFVFLDSQAYRAIHFDWNSPTFVSLRERVSRGSIHVLTTDIVVREVRKGISRAIEDFHIHVAKARSRGHFAQVINDPRLEALAHLDANKIPTKALWDTFDNLLVDLSAQVISPPDTALSTLFALYFDDAPPFDKQGKNQNFLTRPTCCRCYISRNRTA